METIVLPIKEILLLGVLIEAIVQVIKSVLPKQLTEQGKQAISMLIGIFLAFALNVSIFANVPTFTMYIGIVLAGMIASRGSNFVHDLYTSLKDIGTVTK